MAAKLNKNDKYVLVKKGQIDLLEMVQYLWRKKMVIILITAFFVSAGVVISLFSGVEYLASSKVLPENNAKGGGGLSGGLGGLAGLAGINLGGANEGSLSPTTYPEIVESVPFQLEIQNVPIYFSSIDSTLSYKEYFLRDDNKSLITSTIQFVRSLFRSEKKDTDISSNIYSDSSVVLNVSPKQMAVINDLKNRIDFSSDNSTGIIQISVELPDPHAAASMTEIVVTKLTEKVIHTKTEKVKQNLDFVQARYEEAKERYNENQAELALFLDKNKNLSSEYVKLRYQRVQNEVNLSYDLYRNLANQLEQAKIKVKEETPVFMSIQPAVIPLQKSKPQRKLIVIICGVIGGFISIGWLLVNPILSSFQADQGE